MTIETKPDTLQVMVDAARRYTDDPYDDDPDDGDQDDDGDPEDDDFGEEDDGEGDDEGEEGDDGEEEGDEEPEERGRAASAPPVAVPASATISPVAANALSSTPGAPADPGVAKVATFSRDPRSRFLPLSDARVDRIAVLDRASCNLLTLRRPFPDPLEQFVARAYGNGKYRIVQRDAAGKHIGSRTLTVAGEQAVYVETPAATPASANGDGHAPAPAAPAPAAAAPVVDWRSALVTTGLPLVAGLVTAGIEALRSRPEAPARSQLSELVEVAKLLQVGNQERAQLFQEGMKAAGSAEPVPSVSIGDSSINLNEIFSGIAQVVSAWRGTQAAVPSQDAHNVSRGTLPQALPPGGAPAAGDPMTDPEEGKRHVEKLIAVEIKRAVERGDTPETLVVILDAYLPPIMQLWLVKTPEEEVLRKLPEHFPTYSEFLKGEQVQMFLRSTLQMLREDAAAAEAEERDDGVPAAAGPGSAG